MKHPKGKIIAVEGIDGVGKTTLCHRLEKWAYHRFGRKVVYTSAISDGATDFGYLVKGIITDKTADLVNDVECALMVAARVDNWQRIIEPALERGDIVISDRFKSSLFVYQRGRHGARLHPAVATARLNAFGLAREADLTIFLDMDPARTHKPFDDSNRLESRDLDEWREMRQEFRDLWKTTKASVMIDASLSADQVEMLARHHVETLLGD